MLMQILNAIRDAFKPKLKNYVFMRFNPLTGHRDEITVTHFNRSDAWFEAALHAERGTLVAKTPRRVEIVEEAELAG